MPIFFLVFLSIPLIEAALFVVIGGEIGLLWTLATIFITAVIGAFALRAQGFSVLRRMQGMTSLEETPALMMEGGLLLSAGLLLITPGFLTDALGLALLLPPVRSVIARAIIRQGVVVFNNAQAGQRAAQSDASQRRAPHFRPRGRRPFWRRPRRR